MPSHDTTTRLVGQAESPANAWQAILAELKAKLNPLSYETWLRPTRFARVQGDTLFVQVPSSEFSAWITNEWGALISEILSTRTEGLAHVSFLSPQVQLAPPQADARKPGQPEPAALPARRKPCPAIPKLAVVHRFSEISRRQISWLWWNRIPLGKCTLFAGDPGVGKSLVALDIASRVSTGTAFCDGAPGLLGDVVIVSAEDDAEDTIRPRLDVLGADVSRIHLLRAVRRICADGKISEREFSNLGSDLDGLEDALVQLPATQLVVIDPISAYLGATDSYKNADVRRLLSPLAQLAARRNVGIVAITHLSKSGGDPMYRAIGSIAFIAATRAAWLFTKDPDNPARRLMLALKNNLAPDSTGLAFSVQSAASGVAAVAWEQGEVNLPADVALASQDVHDTDAIREAERFLADALQSGPVGVGEVHKQARSLGISDRTLRRAKVKLRLVSSREGFGTSGGWIWSLPKMAKVSDLATFDQPTEKKGDN
jgi:DNA polymerase III delta prime subunit